jgi:type IV pilus biogenesis protein PilP
MKAQQPFVVLLIAATLGSGIAHAESNSAAAGDPPARKDIFDQLDRTNSDNALVAALIENAKLHKQLADIQAGRDPSMQQGATQPVTLGMPSAPAAGTQPNYPAPARGAVVELVTTSPQVNGGAATALISLPSGGRVSAAAGAKVAGIGTVKSVSIHSVIVDDGKHIYALPFDGEDPASVGSR